MPVRRNLAEYRAKRDFAATPEPSPAEALPGRGGPLRFMVHKHSARRLHYDLRLESGCVLLSWAIPRGPSVDPSDRRMAVHVEDHPFAYGSFEGVIPKGQYGAGPSLIWDAGTYSPDEGGQTYWQDCEAAEREVEQGLAAGKLSVTLRGRKLKGSWALVRTNAATDQWLLIKHKDMAARRGVDILEDGRSVASGLTIEELRARGEVEDTEKPEPYAAPQAMAGARPGRLGFVAPMLATAAPLPAKLQGWSFEPKLDGIRALAAIDRGAVRLRSRGGHDLTERYPGIVGDLAAQPVASALFDGEIVAVGPDGRPSFALLAKRMNLQGSGEIAAAERAIPVIYFVFDLLHADGWDLTAVSLRGRREMLGRLLIPSPRIALVETIRAEADAAFEAAVAAGFEGIIAKRDESRYEPGRRSPAWLKRKALTEREFVVGGFTAGKGWRTGLFGGLLLGEPSGAGLVYRGKVGGGFTAVDIERIQRALLRLAQHQSPFAGPTPDEREAQWVRPELKVMVEFSELTDAGVLRTPVFKGLVGDAQRLSGPARAAAVTRDDRVFASLDAQLSDRRQKFILEGDGWALPLTNLDKVLWPQSDARPAVTKRDLLRYALRIAPHALPHLRDRPLTLLRFPNGIEGKKFYQRHWDQERPPFVETVTAYAEGDHRDREWLLCNNLASLLWLCQIADLEWHASLARTSPAPDAVSLPLTFTGSEAALSASPLNHPDFLLFDLDPYIYTGNEGPGQEPLPSRASFDRTCDVARSLKQLLDSLGLASFVKTSGATGVHVYVPIVRNLDYDAVRAAAVTVCAELAARRRGDVTLEWSTERRRGKVFLDANQNARHKSLAAPYSPRAMPGGPISLPQSWRELGSVYPGETSLLDPWWASREDPWANILQEKHDLEALLGLG